MSGFAAIFTFSTPALMVSVLALIVHYATSSLIWRNVRTCMTSFTAQKSATLKIVYNKKKIQIFGMNMPLISSREARKCIFLRGFATHEICIFRFTRWNKWHIHSKNPNILYISIFSASLTYKSYYQAKQIMHTYVLFFKLLE